MPTTPSPDALIAAIRAAVADAPTAIRAAGALTAHDRLGGEPSPVAALVGAELDAYLAAVVEYHHGSTTVAAAALGIPVRTLQYRIARARDRQAA